MFDDNTAATPPNWREIDRRSRELGFDMPSAIDTGAMLRLLAASKPNGRLLELGTGTGLATAWLLDGMEQGARLVSVDSDPAVQAVARTVLDGDRRVTFTIGDGLDFVRSQPPAAFDLIFADAWPGKYEGLDETLALLAPGGFYVVDDMSRQANWPQGHQPRVEALATRLKSHLDLTTVALGWASGLVIAARRS